MQTPASCVAALALALIYEASASNRTQFSIASPVPHGPGQSALVNTPGGSGSTLVMSRLRDAGTSINSPYNEDTLKHKSAAALASLLQQRVIAKVYDRVLIVVNRDMARAVASQTTTAPHVTASAKLTTHARDMAAAQWPMTAYIASV